MLDWDTSFRIQHYACWCAYMFVCVKICFCQSQSLVYVLRFTQLLEVTAIYITKENAHNTTKGAHCMAMATKVANNDCALSKEYLKVRHAELKEPV